MYISKHFCIEELVSKEMFDNVHEDVLWRMFTPGILKTLDAIKDAFPKGSMSVNTWKWGGDRNWSGLRTRDSKWYSEGSRHSCGDAFDCVFSEYTAEEARSYILSHQGEFPDLTRVEGKVSWLHADCKPTGLDKIYVFNV